MVEQEFRVLMTLRTSFPESSNNIKLVSELRKRLKYGSCIRIEFIEVDERPLTLTDATQKDER